MYKYTYIYIYNIYKDVFYIVLKYHPHETLAKHVMDLYSRIAGPNLAGICYDRGMKLLITQQGENSCGDSMFEHICTTHLLFWAQLSQKKGPPKVPSQFQKFGSNKPEIN